MVTRFLGWRLPDEFHPDCFVRFNSQMAKESKSWPTGTNLLSAGQARAMLEHVLGVAAGTPAASGDLPTTLAGAEVHPTTEFPEFLTSMLPPNLAAAWAEPAGASPLPAASPETKGQCNDERACGACFSDQGNCETSPGYIRLTPAEIQSGRTRVDWAEGLILQLPETHDGRNSWLLNYAADKDALQADWARRNPNSTLAASIAPDTRPKPAEAQAAPVETSTEQQLSELASDSGGPAFPTLLKAGELAVSEGGMTMRDYFAAKAMPIAIAHWKNCDALEEGGGNFNWEDNIDDKDTFANDCLMAAQYAYHMADAMLQARKGGAA